MAEEIIHADKKARKKVLILVVLAGIAGAGLAVWIAPAYLRYLQGIEPGRAVVLVKTTLVILFLAPAPIGAHMFGLGRKAAREERFPPSGLKIIRDTKVITGRPAVIRGRIIQTLATVMILLSLSAALYCFLILPRIWEW
ncbi:MAG: hypothetical protein AB1641_19760 [Thermodesulfobacteriota bacterium]